MIHIIDVQSRATMQDLGRLGLRRFGISHSGAMDKLALRAGNILLGNAEGAPAIEVPLGGLTLQFQQDMNFCVTGAFYEMTLDDKPIFAYWRYQARAGQVLKWYVQKLVCMAIYVFRVASSYPKSLTLVVRIFALK